MAKNNFLIHSGRKKLNLIEIKQDEAGGSDVCCPLRAFLHSCRAPSLFFAVVLTPIRLTAACLLSAWPLRQAAALVTFIYPGKLCRARVLLNRSASHWHCSTDFSGWRRPALFTVGKHGGSDCWDSAFHLKNESQIGCVHFFHNRHPSNVSI